MLRYSSTVHVCYWIKKQTGKPEVRLEICQCAEIKEVQLFSFTLEDFPWGVTGFEGAWAICFCHDCHC